MATKIITQLLSDLSGEAASTTTRFGLDGKEYMIDLTEQEDEELREFLTRFVTAGIKIGTVKAAAHHAASSMLVPRTPHPAAAKQGERRQYLDRVRAWAKENQISVSGFGRIPQAVFDLYENRGVLAAAEIKALARRVNEKHQKDTHEVVVNGRVPSLQSDVDKPAKRTSGTVGAEVSIKGATKNGTKPAKATKNTPKVASPAFSSADAGTQPAATRRPRATKRVAAAK